MKLEEMIEQLELYAHVDKHLREQWNAIADALRAGQQMRAQFALPDESKDFPGMIAAIDLFEACKAWDKAVGG